MKKFASFIPACTLLVALFVGLVSTGLPASATTTWTRAKGPTGQTLAASAATNLGDGTEIVVKGAGYNTKVGIYVTYCVVPPKGKRPDLCGPFDITGQNNASTWVSSNPPLYAKLLVKPFGKNGTFKVKLKVTRMIGDQDCTQVKCAVTTRADHTRGDYRKADVFIPVTIAP